MPKIHKPTIFGGKGEIVTRRIASSGVAIDGRRLSASLIYKLYKNTTLLMQEYGHTVAIKLGHDDTQEELRGYIHALRLIEDILPTGEKCVALEADICMGPELYEKHKLGLIPGQSIEYPRFRTYLPNGKSLGPTLTAVALHGKTTDAIGWLRKSNSLRMLNTDFVTNSNMEILKMDEEKSFTSVDTTDPAVIEEAMGALMILANFIQSLAPAEGMGSETESDAPDAGEEDEAEKLSTKKLGAFSALFQKISNAFNAQTGVKAHAKGAHSDTHDFRATAEFQAMQAKIARLEARESAIKAKDAQNAFNTLAAAGKITQSDRAEWDELVKLRGHEFASGIYSKRPSLLPPKPLGLVTTSVPNDAESYAAEVDRVSKTLISKGVQPANAKKIAENMLKTGTDGE